MLKIFLSIIFLCVAVAQSTAQTAHLTVQINKEWLQPGDTLDILGTYEKGDKKLPPATLAVVLQQNDGPNKWKMRWPMIDGEAMGSIIFPQGLPAGKYTLYTAVQPRFFRAYGRIFEPAGLTEMALRVVDEAGGIADMNLPVDHSGFLIKDLLFENEAVLEFSNKGKKQAIFSLEAWLDSAYTPVAATAKEIAFGVPQGSIAFQKISPDAARAKTTTFADPFYEYKKLDSSGLSTLQKFDSLYVSSAFKIGVDTIFNCMENADWQKARDIDEFLRNVLPGFDEANFETFPVLAKVNKEKYVLYLNEQLLYANMLGDLALSDIAMIKIFKPGFKPTAKAGDGRGGIAIYIRQGPFEQQNIYSPIRHVKGYQPLVYKLTANRAIK